MNSPFPAWHGRREGGEQFTGLAWESVVEVSKSASGLACLPALELAALGIGEALPRLARYTGHGGLLPWIRDLDYPSFLQGGSPWESLLMIEDKLERVHQAPGQVLRGLLPVGLALLQVVDRDRSFLSVGEARI